MQLHIVSGSRDPAGDPRHRLIAKKGRLQRFHKESSAYPELGKAFQKNPDLVPFRRRNPALWARRQESVRGRQKTADAEFGVDRDADFDRFSGIHAL